MALLRLRHKPLLPRPFSSSTAPFPSLPSDSTSAADPPPPPSLSFIADIRARLKSFPSTSPPQRIPTTPPRPASACASPPPTAPSLDDVRRSINLFRNSQLAASSTSSRTPSFLDIFTSKPTPANRATGANAASSPFPFAVLRESLHKLDPAADPLPGAKRIDRKSVFSQWQRPGAQPPPEWVLGRELKERVGDESKMSENDCGSAGVQVDKSRAWWNPRLEKALVDLLHELNNPSYRGDNGWSSEAWNKIVKEFNEKHPYVNLKKQQIQNKEQELKKDYKMLKDARKQCGASWDDNRCMIVADPPIWANIITSYPRAKKFRRKPFPLFDALRDLYDGQTAEGSMNFTSLEPSQHVILTQVDNVDDYVETENLVPDSYYDECNDMSTPSQHTTSAIQHELHQRQSNAPNGDKGENAMKRLILTQEIKEKSAKKRKQDKDVADMMGRYLEIRTKQAEEEASELARERADVRCVDDFSIRSCISVLNTMEDLSNKKKVKAFGVFKDAQNREIFISAEPVTRLLWLRSVMDM